MKKFIALICVAAILAVTLCSCGSTCEHCGESTLMTNLVGDEANGINVCDTCIEKMRMSKLSFNFTCAECQQEIVGKKNETVINGETVYVCNTCNQNG